MVSAKQFEYKILLSRRRPEKMPTSGRSICPVAQCIHFITFLDPSNSLANDFGELSKVAQSPLTIDMTIGARYAGIDFLMSCSDKAPAITASAK
jgi:hypothetical protein